ncbi:hypothetical protein D3C74_318270 [compost metagenome]
MGPVDRAVRPVRQPGRGQGREHHGVTDPATRLLEVGLDQVRDLARPLGPLLGRGQELGQAAPRGRAPVREHGRRGPVHHERVARDRTDVEPPDRRRDVLGRDLAALGQRPHRMVQVDALVPQRVPEAFGDRRDLLGRVAATVVHEHQVEVARGPHVRAPQAPHGREGHTLGARAGRGLLPEGREPVRDQGADRRAASHPRAARAAQVPGHREHLGPEAPHPRWVRGLRRFAGPLGGPFVRCAGHLDRAPCCTADDSMPFSCPVRIT